MRICSLITAAMLMAAGLGQQTNSDSNLIIQSSAREVLLEVVVHDSRGRLVTKIDPAEVAVYEDGARQEIRSFRLVTGREVRAQDEQAAQAAAAAQSGSPSPASAPPAFNSLRTVNVVCLILNDLSPDTRSFAFDAARKFVDKELRPDTFIGVFSLDASGLRPVFPFSNNRERLVKAIQLAAVNQLPATNQSSSAMLNGLSFAVLGNLNPGTVNDGSDDLSPDNPQGIVANPLGTRGAMGFAVNAGLREIDSLSRLVKQLTPLPFQKAVVVMGTGLTRPPDQMEYWRSLIASARKGGVTFYGLDVYGLGNCQDNSDPDCVSGTTLDASRALLQKGAALSQGQATMGLNVGPTEGTISGPGPPPGGVAMESMHQTDYLRFGVTSADRQGALRDIAESTGGFLIANTNNTDKLLARVMEEVDTHFEISYRPTSTINDGHFRKIAVKLDKPGWRVETRSGYFAVPDTGDGPLTPADMTGLRALDSKPQPHAFDFRSKAFRFRSGEDQTQYSIAFEVPIASLTATPEPGGQKQRLHVSLLAVVKDAQGEIVHMVSKDVPSDVANQYLPSLRTNVMNYEHAIDLKPGHYTIETAVVDQEGHRSSTNIVPVDATPHQGLSVSDIVLVRRVNVLNRPQDLSDPFEFPGKRAQPYLTTSLGLGATPIIYFVIYPDGQNTDTPTIEAQFFKHGRLVSTQNSPLSQRDSSGAIPMAIEPTGGPGDYEVQIKVDQGGKSVQQSLKYTIAK